MKFRVVLGLLVASWVFFGVIEVRERIQSVVDSPMTSQPDTVWMKPEVIDEVLSEANIPPKPTIIERITEVEVQPDTVYVAKSDSTYSPEDLPEYGILKVEKEGKRLEVTSLQKEGKEVQKNVYTLPEEDSDYTLTSGASPASLRVSRTWNVVSLEGQAILTAGAGGIQGVVTGPVSLNLTPNLAVSPAIMMDSDDGASVGVAIHLEF